MAARWATISCSPSGAAGLSAQPLHFRAFQPSPPPPPARRCRLRSPPPPRSGPDWPMVRQLLGQASLLESAETPHISYPELPRLRPAPKQKEGRERPPPTPADEQPARPRLAPVQAPRKMSTAPAGASRPRQLSAKPAPKQRRRQRAAAAASPQSSAASPRKLSASERRTSGPHSHQPFTQQEFMEVKASFEVLDSDKSGGLDWNELCDIGTRLGGRQIDYREFKRIDKDRSGTVSFMELLRMLYPGTPVSVLRAAVKRWGSPHATQQTGATGTGEKASPHRWRDRLDPQSAEELLSIFELYHGSRQGGVTLEELRRSIPSTHFPDAYLVELFHSHNRSGDGLMKIHEFAAMMDRVYGRRSERGPIKLYFQPEVFMRDL